MLKIVKKTLEVCDVPGVMCDSQEESENQSATETFLVRANHQCANHSIVLEPPGINLAHGVKEETQATDSKAVLSSCAGAYIFIPICAYFGRWSDLITDCRSKAPMSLHCTLSTGNAEPLSTGKKGLVMNSHLLRIINGKISPQKISAIFGGCPISKL